MGLTVTMDAEQGVELMRTVRPQLAIPIHYDDYEAFKSPLSDFVSAVCGRRTGGSGPVRRPRRPDRPAVRRPTAPSGSERDSGGAVTMRGVPSMRDGHDGRRLVRLQHHLYALVELVL